MTVNRKERTHGEIIFWLERSNLDRLCGFPIEIWERLDWGVAVGLVGIFGTLRWFCLCGGNQRPGKCL